MVNVPFVKRERPPAPVPEQVDGIDLPWCDGVSEIWWKRTLTQALKKNIQFSIYWIKRLNAPVKAKDMPEIEEEGSDNPEAKYWYEEHPP